MKQELDSQLTKEMLNHPEDKVNQQKESTYLRKSTKKKLKHQEDKGKAKTLGESKTQHLFLIERLGYLFILFSGLVPFLHSFVKFEKLEEKLFGFTSIQSFLYSFGVHLSILFLTIGVLFAISVGTSDSRYKVIQHHLRYALISPFISAIFYCTWVFIPNVNYDLLAYVFLTIFICVLSVLIYRRITNHIEAIKVLSEHKETVLNNGLSYLKTKLSKGGD